VPAFIWHTFGQPQVCLQPYAYSYSQPLSLYLNCSLVSVLRRYCGSLFKIVGLHTRNCSSQTGSQRFYTVLATRKVSTLNNSSTVFISLQYEIASHKGFGSASGSRGFYTRMWVRPTVGR